MKILGIDPGTLTIGFGLIEVDKSKVRPLTYGVISTSRMLEFPRRLKQIYDGICKIISKESPEIIAIEDIFLGKNFKTAVRMGEVRGVVIVAAINYGLEVIEYSPTRIKESITGYGQADKSQIQRMIVNLLELNQPPDENASDALAVAVCHYHSLRSYKVQL